MEENTKIIFEYFNEVKNECELESAWAVRIDDNTYKLDNILFYAPEYSFGDIVSTEERNGELYVTGLVRESGHSTVRILFNDVNDVIDTRIKLKDMGCDSEISNISSLISIDIPPDVDYKIIRQYLESGEEQGKWGYEEACIAHKL